MKQTPKIKLILYFCLGLFVLNACTLEENVVKEQAHQEKMKLESKSFHELLQTSLFSTAYKKVINKKVILSNDFAARTALEDQYGFTIVEDQPVKVITDVDGITYYTIAIERDVKEELKFENLVIKVDSTSVGAVILKYELNEKAVYLAGHDSYVVDVKETSIQPLQVDGKIAFTGDCVTTFTLMCNQSWTNPGTIGPEHVCQEACLKSYSGTNFIYVVSNTTCINSGDGGGGGNPTPIGTPGGEGGGGTGGVGTSTTGPPNPDGETPIGESTPPIKTVIIPSEEVVEEEENTPCISLKKKCSESDTIFMQKFNSLNTDAVKARDHETGYAARKVGGGTVYEYAEGTSGSPSTPFINNYHSAMHVHNNDYYKIHNNGDEELIKTVKMFSPTDVERFLFNMQSTANSSAYTNMDTYSIMISSEGIFALKLLNVNQTFPIPLSNAQFTAFKKEYEKKASKITENSITSTRSGKLQKLLIEMLKKYGLENVVGLFEGKVTNSQQGKKKINWSRKTVVNNELINNPC